MNRCYVLLAVLLASNPADAQAIRAAVEHAARDRLLDLVATAGLSKPSVEIAIVTPNSEIPCMHTARINAIDTRSAARMRFAAECDDPAARIEVIVRATIVADVVVAATGLRAGVPIEAAALEIERRELQIVGDAIAEPAEVVGKSSRRALRRGQLLSRRNLVEPVLVKRGASVDIVARNVGVAVTVAGEALEAGRRDEIVRVRNKANGTVIRARIIDATSVEPVDMSSSSR